MDVGAVKYKLRYYNYCAQIIVYKNLLGGKKMNELNVNEMMEVFGGGAETDKNFEGGGSGGYTHEHDMVGLCSSCGTSG